ncbi:MAG: hypothetical protein ABI237_03335 [Ginsengibacter sp.]
MMHKIRLIVSLFVLFAVLHSCSKKTHPSVSNPSVMENGAVTGKTFERRTPKATFPKVITVNDSAARKSVDGRLYYDVMGHRYWRNYKDGKYYLFNKSMYNNAAFDPDFKKKN